ncbi:MAG: peptide-methionine (R)-S-oxide reductase MsrB [Candidatus Sericytochromatia bacterium]|nr:peptide-methionine (R)-S-oxide reductase MsrB [Candidatus Sericytochromatia bacterium]
MKVTDLASAALLVGLFACPASAAGAQATRSATLSADAWHCLRMKGTERPFTGAFWQNHEPGIYRCGDCRAVLFDSRNKFDSGTGWPSFDRPAASASVRLLPDRSHGMDRTEVQCARCGGHLGHVFDDGPATTGQRFCINSASLVFEARPARSVTSGPRAAGSGKGRP